MAKNEGLDKAHEKLREMYHEREKPERLNPLQKLKQKPNSRALALNAMCYVCQGEDSDPGYKWRQGNCEDEECPLHNFRPHQKMLGEEMPIGLKKCMEIDIIANPEPCKSEVVLHGIIRLQFREG